ncbi:argininosuccinate lyase [Dactylosporangium sp. NPDC000555]|uniref:argininosuccinate lyase n=1 Tax=Dactylosporangium sp. NPDC000555 TaxID=3154260 RepID=UPI00331BC45C
MSGTGRLVGQLGPRTQRVVYGEPTGAALHQELSLTARIDRAHLVMLAESGLIDKATAAVLLRCIGELEAAGFAPLAGRPAPRGLYLMYEQYLAERLGADVGGVLHTARSRNDLKATATALRLRDRLLDLIEDALRLLGVLLARARAHRDVLMPSYTHHQAAMPVTYGYYLLGVAEAVARDVDALRGAAAGLASCPLGAGAVAGTDLRIAPQRTARLLGFATPARHAADAVASRDTALRALAAATGLAVTLSRVAGDLQLWSTAEFGLIWFPDRLVGSSSAMPQKRNAFLLEHLLAKPAHAVGAWTAMVTAMAGAPFSNTIEVGTEAVAALWPGLQAVHDAVQLAQVVVLGARPVPDRMRERIRDGFTTATAIANRLVRDGIPFRTAHRMVGAAVRQAVEAGTTDLAPFGLSDWLTDVDTEPAAVVAAQRYGGGPGAFEEAFRPALAEWAALRAWCGDRRADARHADQELRGAVALLAGIDSPEEGP